MLNMLDTQDKLKNFSEQQLIQEMQMPTGSAPQFMVLGEIERRKRMRGDAQRQEGLMQPTVAQEAVTAAGVPQQGIAQVAQSMAPKTDMTQNTGVPTVQAAGLPAQPNQPQRMADGGVLRLAPGGELSGGTLSAIAALKVNRPDIYAMVKDDPQQLRQAARLFLESADTPEQTGLESIEAKPRFRDRNIFGPSNRAASRNRRAIEDAQPDYALAQRADSLRTMRDMAEGDSTFAEGMPNEFVSGTTGPTPVTGIEAMLTAPAPASGDLSYRINPALDGVVMPAPDMGIKTPSGFGENPMPMPTVDAAPDVSGLTEEQARRLYLSGRDYEESDVPAIVDMLNRGREFQQSDTYTPPEEIYDLGPLGGLKYEMDGATPFEKYREFNAVSNRLAREAAAGEEAASEASLDRIQAERDAQRAADIAVDRRISADQPKEPAGVIESMATDVADYIESGLEPYRKEKAALTAASSADETAVDRMGGIVPFSQTELGRQQAADKIAEAVAPAGKSGGTGSIGGVAGANKDSSPAEKKMDQDKWLALAQAGFTLMSTGDFGKAGQAGIASLQQARAEDREERKLDAEMMLRKAQLAAANRKGTSSGSALTANQLLSRGNDLIKSGQTMLENAGDNADAAAEARTLITAGQELIRRVTGGVASSESAGSIKLPSAG